MARTSAVKLNACIAMQAVVKTSPSKTRRGRDGFDNFINHKALHFFSIIERCKSNRILYNSFTYVNFLHLHSFYIYNRFTYVKFLHLQTFYIYILFTFTLFLNLIYIYKPFTFTFFLQ